MKGLILSTLLIWILGLDRAVAAIFYKEGDYALVWQRWPGQTDPFWLGIYKVAALPALTLSLCALLVFLSSFQGQRLCHWRRPAMFIILLLALGPGLVVNVALKDTLGKPRPSEIIEFGGSHPYAEFWEPGTGQKNGSFPSGHASVAFAVIAPWFFLRHRWKSVAFVFLAAGLGWGAVVGFGRMLQGGHYLSDVIWAGGLVYLVGWLLALCLAVDRSLPPPKCR